VIGKMTVGEVKTLN